MIHRDDARSHGLHEQRLVQVVTVDGLLLPNRPLRPISPPGPAGTGPWRTPSTGYATSSSERTSPRSVRTRNTPAVPATVRDLVRGALKLAGYDNTAAGRRAHTERHRVLCLYGIT